MLPSKGYFSRINCPFFDDTVCNRLHCHFKHSKKIKNNVQKNSDTNRNKENDNLFIKHLVTETVKQVFNRMDLKDGTEGNPDISTVVEDVVSDIQNSATNATFLTTLYTRNTLIPEYKPTPIEKLNRHIPVQVAPTRPSYQLSSHRNKNASCVHTAKNINMDGRLKEAVTPSVESYDAISGNDSSNKNVTPSFGDQHTFLSSDVEKISQFEYYTITKASEKSPFDSFELTDKSVALVDKNNESNGKKIDNDEVQNVEEKTIYCRKQSLQKKIQSNLHIGTTKSGTKICNKNYYQQEKTCEITDCIEQENNVKTEDSNQKKKEKSEREVRTKEANDWTEVLDKTGQKLNENNNKNLENTLDISCQQKALEKREELNNLNDENLTYKERVCKLGQKITNGSLIGENISIPSPNITKKNHKTGNYKVKRLSIVGGGLPCNSLISGPFMELLGRWRKAREKIQKASQDNSYVAKVPNVESLLSEKNELLLKPPMCSQQNSLIEGNEANEFVKPIVKRRIAHQNTFDTTVNTILEQKFKKSRRSL